MVQEVDKPHGRVISANLLNQHICDSEGFLGQGFLYQACEEKAATLFDSWQCAASCDTEIV